MTTIPLNCEGFAEALAGYLEREDTPRIRAAVEAHAASCVECGSLLADLQRLRVDAAGLPLLTPSRDLWSGIAERIEAPVVAIGAGRRYVREASRRRMWLRPMAAAAALVVITAGVTYFVTRQAVLGPTQVASRPVDSASIDPRKLVQEALDSALRADRAEKRVAEVPGDSGARRGSRAQAGGSAPAESRAPRLTPRAPALLASDQAPAQTIESVYGREIARLRRIIDERRGQLDTATVHVLERNVAVIDRAIAESRAALAKDPASVFLNEQLNTVLEQKIELLRATALLPVRS